MYRDKDVRKDIRKIPKYNGVNGKLFGQSLACTKQSKLFVQSLVCTKQLKLFVQLLVCTKQLKLLVQSLVCTNQSLVCTKQLKIQCGQVVQWPGRLFFVSEWPEAGPGVLSAYLSSSLLPLC